MSSDGKKHPEISVVIPTSNRRAMLAEAINSVQAQTNARWELIVVDDASTDDTWSFLSGLRDTRIRCFRQEKKYERSAARNLGLANARSEFIMFLDDDDLLWPGTLSVLKGALEKHPDTVAAMGHAGIGSLTNIMKDATSTSALCDDVIFSMNFYSAGRQYLARTCTVQRSCGMSVVMTNQ